MYIVFVIQPQMYSPFRSPWHVPTRAHMFVDVGGPIDLVSSMTVLNNNRLLQLTLKQFPSVCITP